MAKTLINNILTVIPDLKVRAIEKQQV